MKEELIKNIENIAKILKIDANEVYSTLFHEFENISSKSDEMLDSIWDHFNN